MTPDELRRMDMDYCIIYEKGIKPVKAKKVFFYKTNMIKEFNKFKLNHNQFDAGVRGTWRKFNPYNPDQGIEEEQRDLKVESLDDLFEDDDLSNEIEEKDNISKAENTISQKVSNKKTKNEITDSDLDELLFDENEEEENGTKNDNIIDIQKELEAKFDELFGPIDEDEN
jgi:type IV secretory pathway TraG/TraD family ATPase VirD4